MQLFFSGSYWSFLRHAFFQVKPVDMNLIEIKRKTMLKVKLKSNLNSFEKAKHFEMKNYFYCKIKNRKFLQKNSKKIKVKKYCLIIKLRQIWKTPEGKSYHNKKY